MLRFHWEVQCPGSRREGDREVGLGRASKEKVVCHRPVTASEQEAAFSWVTQDVFQTGQVDPPPFRVGEGRKGIYLLAPSRLPSFTGPSSLRGAVTSPTVLSCVPWPLQGVTGGARPRAPHFIYPDWAWRRAEQEIFRSPGFTQEY